MKCVVKRKGIEEPYDEKKVYASCYAAALNCHYSEKKSEKIAYDVMKKINAWIKKKKSVGSKEIRDKVISNLKDRDVALMYEHHLDLS
ncbi:MAG: hypothetical protein IIA87_01120 [Nanoarchaeota archaeon]|nr:hypothetical protein [Nanoarchaeota archaeon]